MNKAGIAGFFFCVFFGLQLVLQSKYVRTSIHPLQLLFLTNVTAFIILTLYHAVTNRNVFCITATSQMVKLFIAATFCWIIADTSTIVGLSTSSSINFSLISRLQLFLTYLGAVLFLRETVVARKVVALIIAFVGSLILVYQGQMLRFTVGDVLFVLFALAITVSGLLRQNIAKAFPVHQLTYYMIAGMTLFSGILMSATFPLTAIPIPGFIIINALLMLTGFTLVNYSIMHGGATQFSLISGFLPVATAFFAYIILGEALTVNQLLGGLVILGSVLLFTWKKK